MKKTSQEDLIITTMDDIPDQYAEDAWNVNHSRELSPMPVQ